MARQSSKNAVSVNRDQSLTGSSGRGRRHMVTGEVVSNKMQKTISVQTFTMVRHVKYGKFVKKTSVFKAHDEKGEAKVGDIVRIAACRPLSKTKRWKLAGVVRQGHGDLGGEVDL